MFILWPHKVIVFKFVGIKEFRKYKENLELKISLAPRTLLFKKENHVIISPLPIWHIFCYLNQSLFLFPCPLPQCPPRYL